MSNNQKPYYQPMQKTGHLVFIKETEPFIRVNGRPRRQGLFKCDCGAESIKRLESVKSGKTLSCGCMKGKLISKNKTYHGKCGTHLYFVWRNMKVRCFNKNDYHYEWYGKRGITVCSEWKNSFQSFYEWAVSAKWKKGLTIDRIDNNGNYEPSNCRFVTQKVNSNNTREIRKTNTSGYKNITKIKTRFRLIINNKHIGVFETIQEAIQKRDEKNKEISINKL